MVSRAIPRSLPCLAALRGPIKLRQVDGTCDHALRLQACARDQQLGQERTRVALEAFHPRGVVHAPNAPDLEI